MPRHALALVIGTLIAFYANSLPDPFWVAFAPLLACLAWACPERRFLLLTAAAYLYGSGVFHAQLQYRLDSTYDNQVTLIRAVVSDIPEVDAGRIRLLLRPLSIEGYAGKLPRRVRINWYQVERRPHSGEIWEFEVRLRQPSSRINPGGFDYAAWLFVHGIDAVGAIRRSPHNRRLTEASRLGTDYWRARLAAAIDRHCSSCRHAGLIKALALGYRGDILPAQRRTLVATGTAHLLAISGLHIGIVAAAFFAVGRAGWRFGLYRSGCSRANFASLLGLVGALLYAMLAGFSLPTLRALVMFGALSLALLWRSRINLLQSISLAIIVILVTDPRAIGSASFWLSISALLIIAFARLGLPPGMPWWRQLLGLQCYFSLLLIPLGILLFDQLNPASLCANLVAIPLVSFILLPLVLLACFGLAFGIAGPGSLLALADAGLGMLLRYLDWLQSGWLESIGIAGLPYGLLLLLMVAVGLILIPGAPRLRLSSLLLLWLAFDWKPDRLEQGEFELSVLDVGMGTSVLLRTRTHSLVYDFGPGIPGIYSAADQALLPLLRRLRIDLPDLLVVSHVDQDHSGGLDTFRGRYAPYQLLTGTPGELEARFGFEHPVRSCHGFPAWRWDGVDFRFLALDPPAHNSRTNNRSCVLAIDGIHHALLPGDIEAVQEARLLARFGANLNTDILLAPHHGSATSSSLAFVRQTSPQYVVFTVSRHNRWRFPRPEVSARYSGLGSQVLRSDRDGALRLHSGSQGLVLERARRPAQRIWRRW